jgi:hypothetical protein
MIDPIRPAVDASALIMGDPDELDGHAVWLWNEARSLNGEPITGHPNPEWGKRPELKAAAVWLAMQYHDARKPPSTDYVGLVLALTGTTRRSLIEQTLNLTEPLTSEAVALIHNVIDPKRSTRKADTFRQVAIWNVGTYWSCINFEATFAADPLGRNPSVASTYAVASHVLKHNGFDGFGMRMPKKPNADPVDRESAKLKSAERTVKLWRQKRHYHANVRLFREPWPSGRGGLDLVRDCVD